MNIKELFDGLPLFEDPEFPNRRPHMSLTDVVTRLEQATDTAVFVCVRTVLRDGYYDAPGAYQHGCRVFVTRRHLTLPGDAVVFRADEPEGLLGMLAERCYGNPGRNLTVFGVTGSHGKTSVVLMTAALLRRYGHRVATITTDGIDDGRHFTPSGPIVPDASDYGRALRQFCDAGAEFAILEFSPYQLAGGACCSIPFSAVLLTDLLPQKNGQGTRRSAREHVENISVIFKSGTPISVLPVGFSDFPVSGRSISVGPGGDFEALCIRELTENGGPGSCFSLREGAACLETFLPIPGEAALTDAAFAAVLSRIGGLSLSQITSAFPEVMAEGRLQRIAKINGASIFLDTAYEAETLKTALRSLRGFATGRLCVVLGSVGGRAKSRRAELGNTAVTYADCAYFTADDPDSESVDRILAEMTDSLTGRGIFRLIRDRRQAIIQAVLDLREGDVLLILGKGRIETQLISGKLLPFSDRDTVFEAMRNL